MLFKFVIAILVIQTMIRPILKNFISNLIIYLEMYS